MEQVDHLWVEQDDPEEAEHLAQPEEEEVRGLAMVVEEQHG